MPHSSFTRKRSRASFWLLLVVTILTTQRTNIVCQAWQHHFSNNINNNRPNNDPYKVLGVSTTATAEEIKHGYRNLAKQHHPDKGGNPDTFATIANAYEILSDPIQRRRYDQQNFRQQRQSTKPPSQQQQDARRKAQFYQEHQQRQEEARLRREREKEEKIKKRDRRREIEKVVRPMQKQLLNLHTVEDMIQEGIINQDRVFVKNFMGAFVGNKRQEKLLDDEFLFPYPFSGIGRNGLVWNTVLQTAKIRYNKPTDLTSIFKVPHWKNGNSPYIVFGRVGDYIHNIKVFSPIDGLQSEFQEHLEHWVTHQYLSNRITIINRHHSPVKLFLILDQTKQKEVLIHTLQPGHAVPFAVHVGDKIVAVDARVDAYPGSPSFDSSLFQGHQAHHQFEEFSAMTNPASWYFQNPAILGEYMVGLETTLEIEEEPCFDLSLKCQSWTAFGRGRIKQGGQPMICQEQPEFMHHICPASCGICQRNQNSWLQGLSYRLRDAPLYYWPQWVRPIVHFSRFAWQDFQDVMAMRRTIALMFWTIGVVLGANAFVIPMWLVGGFVGKASTTPVRAKLTLFDVATFGVLAATLGFWAWLQYTASPFNSALRRDWDHVFRMQMDAMYGLIGWGASLALLGKVIMASVWVPRTNLAQAWSTKLAYSSLAMAIFTCFTVAVVVLAIVMDPSKHREQRWLHLWNMRKNIAFALAFTGMTLGLSMGPLWKCIRRYSILVVLALVDVAVTIAFDVISMKDSYFIKDLDHVLSFRMSAAIPIAIFGVLVGFGIPFGILEIWPIRSTGDNRRPQKSMKLKAD